MRKYGHSMIVMPQARGKSFIIVLSFVNLSPALKKLRQFNITMTVLPRLKSTLKRI